MFSSVWTSIAGVNRIAHRANGLGLVVLFSVRNRAAANVPLFRRSVPASRYQGVGQSVPSPGP